MEIITSTIMAITIIITSRNYNYVDNLFDNILHSYMDINKNIIYTNNLSHLEICIFIIIIINNIYYILYTLIY